MQITRGVFIGYHLMFILRSKMSRFSLTWSIACVDDRCKHGGIPGYPFLQTATRKVWDIYLCTLHLTRLQWYRYSASYRLGEAKLISSRSHDPRLVEHTRTERDALPRIAPATLSFWSSKLFHSRTCRFLRDCENLLSFHMVASILTIR